MEDWFEGRTGISRHVNHIVVIGFDEIRSQKKRNKKPTARAQAKYLVFKKICPSYHSKSSKAKQDKRKEEGGAQRE